MIRRKLKSMHRSLVNRFNAAAGIIAIGLPIAQDSAPALSAYVPQNIFHWLMGIVIVGNILLRTFRTSQPIETK